MEKLGKSVVLENAKNRIEELLEAGARSIEECKQSVEKFDHVIEAETAKKAAAYSACDGEAYKKAAEAIENAKNCAAMYREKLAKQNAEALISDEEYKELVSSIKSELDLINITASKYLVTMADNIASICDDVLAYTVEGNKLLHDLQHNVKKDHAEVTTDRGITYHSETREEKYTNYDVINFKNRVFGKNPEAPTGNILMRLRQLAEKAE